ncbi:MAG TPA: sigma-70 family RNA polymerase sigma factor [Gemmataceae bacterium]|nr:sigma-70 family RNA polymerase sigma factor [Gemmataceae bacterium]
MSHGMDNDVLPGPFATAEPNGAAPADCELLEAFRRQSDEAAFETIVRRYGSLVMGVCRRSLGNEHDAADAFQAVFLVLARKASSIRSADALSAWLHGVAVRTSLKARAVRHKRLAHEKQVSKMPEPTPEPLETSAEALACLDEEVRALPQKLRVAVVLCELEGRSRKEAAALLNLAEGTLSSRLARARTKLGERLRGRGIALPAAALATLLAQSAAQASVPTTLVVGTVKAAVLLNAGKAAAAVASAEVASLTDGVLTTMLVAKLKVVFTVIAATCLVSVGLVASIGLVGEDTPDEAAAVAALEKLGAKLTWAIQPAPVEQRSNTSRKLSPNIKLTDSQMPPTKAAGDKLSAPVQVPAIKDKGNKKAPATGPPDGPPVQEIREKRPKGPAVYRQPGNTGPPAAEEKPRKILVGVDLEGRNVTDLDLRHLAPLKHLQKLVLRRTKVTNAGMKQIAAVATLQTLEIGHNSLTDDGIKDLAQLVNLRQLGLEELTLTDTGLESLRPLVRLGILSLDGTGVSDAGLKSLAAFPQLVSLNLSRTNVSDAGLPKLAALPNLTWLALDENAITDAGLKDLGALASLTSLWLNGTKLTDTGLHHLTRLQKLRTFLAEHTKLTDAGVKHLVSLPNLDMVSLKQTKVTDAGVKDLVQLRNLRWLNLNETALGDAGLKDIATLRKLTYLSIHATKITDAGIKELVALKKLHTLHVSWNQVTVDGLKELLPLRSLAVLWLGGLPITDDGLKVIAGFKNLETLWLDWTKVTDEGLKELAGLKKLKELRLNNTAVTDEGMKALAALQKLKQLEVSQTGVTDAGAQTLKDALGDATINTHEPTAADVEDPTMERGRSLQLVLALMAVSLVGGGAIALHVYWRRKPLSSQATTAESALLPASAGFVVLQCSGCGRSIKVPSELLGRKGKCPQCGQVMSM